MRGRLNLGKQSEPKPRKGIGFAEGSIPGRWSVSHGVKTIPATPEGLMSEINSAISNLEYARATAFLEPPSSSFANKKRFDGTKMGQYDARMADEAFKAGCASLAVGELGEALRYLNVSLSKCPPDKTSAVSKLQSLISLTSQQLQKSNN